MRAKKAILAWLLLLAMLFVIPLLLGIVFKIITYTFNLGWNLL